MKTPSASPAPAELLHETDARMVQALENFFQRSHDALQDAIARAATSRITLTETATAQTCLDWLDASPEALSAAFATQFRHHLERPGTFADTQTHYPAELQLVDDCALRRQLATENLATQLTENLRADMLLLFGRLQALRRAALEDETHAGAYGPLPIVRALSHALDTLELDSAAGTLLLQCAHAPLQDTLKQTYTSISRFLAAQDIPALPVKQILPLSAPRKTAADAGLTSWRTSSRSPRTRRQARYPRCLTGWQTGGRAQRANRRPMYPRSRCASCRQTPAGSVPARSIWGCLMP